MKVADTQRMLTQLRDTFVASGATATTNGLDRLIASLDAHKDVDLERFLELLAGELDPVTIHSASLRAADTDEAAFAKAFAALKADKSVRNAELNQIGSIYLGLRGFGQTFKSRADKLKQIEFRFRQKRSFEASGKVIDNVSPWQ